MIVVLLLLTLRRVYCCFSCQLSISLAIRLSLFCFNFSLFSFIFFLLLSYYFTQYSNEINYAQFDFLRFISYSEKNEGDEIKKLN